jgi:hypothetical protein
MERNGGLKENGAIVAWTKTQTITAFGGFHGAVRVVCCNGDAPIAITEKRRFGVDGCWIGTCLGIMIGRIKLARMLDHKPRKYLS